MSEHSKRAFSYDKTIFIYQQWQYFYFYALKTTKNLPKRLFLAFFHKYDFQNGHFVPKRPDEIFYSYLQSSFQPFWRCTVFVVFMVNFFKQFNTGVNLPCQVSTKAGTSSAKRVDAWNWKPRISCLSLIT